MLDTTKLADQAFELGKNHGKNAGSWVIDGNTSYQTCVQIIEGYDAGDPEIMEMEPAPLSGEWAGDPTPNTLADDLGLPEDARDTELDQLCTDYELGFSEGYWEVVLAAARVQVS